MEFDAVRFVVDTILDERLRGIHDRLSALEIAHETEHPTVTVDLEPEGVPVEALEELPVETPAIVVIDDGEATEQVEALTEQVEALTDAVAVLADESVTDAVEDAVENAVEDAVENVVESTETESEPDETLEVETDTGTVELPIVEQEIKPERRGFLDRPLFGRR